MKSRREKMSSEEKEMCLIVIRRWSVCLCFVLFCIRKKRAFQICRHKNIILHRRRDVLIKLKEHCNSSEANVGPICSYRTRIHARTSFWTCNIYMKQGVHHVCLTGRTGGGAYDGGYATSCMFPISGRDDCKNASFGESSARGLRPRKRMFPVMKDAFFRKNAYGFGGDAR